MKKWKIVFIVTISFVFSGCGGLKYPTTFYDPSMTPKAEIVRNPELGVISRVEVGENLYTKSYLFYSNTKQVTLLEPAIGNGFGAYVDTTKSQKTLVGELKKWDTIGQTDINTFCIEDTFVCLTDMNNSGYFTHFGAYAQVGSNKLNKPAKYIINSMPPSLKEDSFKYEALYQGRIDNKIKISFREFKNDIARPAFTQDIEYQLDENGKANVGFKGLRIEILKATNYDIEYKVVKDYN
jgi:hypothetical protein